MGSDVDGGDVVFSAFVVVCVGGWWFRYCGGVRGLAWLFCSKEVRAVGLGLVCSVWVVAYVSSLRVVCFFTSFALVWWRQPFRVGSFPVLVDGFRRTSYLRRIDACWLVGWLFW